MRRLTHDEFVSKIRTDIKTESLYKSSRDKIEVLCKICKYRWKPVALLLLHGHGCPKCGLEKSRLTKKWNISQEMFLKKINKNFYKNIVIIGIYKHQHCNITVQCKKCKRKWVSSPYKLYRQSGCNNCIRKTRGARVRKRHEEYVKQINSIHNNSIEVLDKYITGRLHIRVRCNKCYNIWSKRANYFLRRGCPYCITSKGEEKIYSILLNNNKHIVRQYKFDNLKLYRFDFAVFKYNKLSYLIEYDGEQHFKPIPAWGGMARFNRQVQIDKIKDKYCKDNDIRLIRISYKQYNNISIKDLL